MRELGIIDDEQQARVLADYLLTLDIATRIIPNRDGRFGVWVQREDRIEPARQALDDFRRDPAGERFQAAGRVARDIRKRAEAIEARHRKNSRDLADHWARPLYRRAPVTFALILASVGVFVLQEKVYPGVVIDLVFSGLTITEDGVLGNRGFANIREGQAWRLVTPIFLHFGIWHILFNMLALSSLGQRVEMAKGRWRYLAMILLTAVASNVGQALAGTGVVFGGMSGVVFALAGYLWMRGRVAPEEGIGLDARNAQLMFGWLLLGFLAPVLFPGGQGDIFRMANYAHGVGLASGLALGLSRF